jgi:hypothetical protein
MTIRKIIDWAIQDAKTVLTGTIASPFYQYVDDSGNWCWACDVDIGTEDVLRCVPVASNNRDIYYAEQGKGVNLSKLNNGKWVITGLSKSVNSTTHYIFLTLSDDLFTVVRTELRGLITRPLTYGELGSVISPSGYGILPYGVQGRFQADGTFVEIVEWI